MKSHSAIVQFLLKHYVTYDSIAKPDAEVQSRRQGSMASAEYAQELWTGTLGYGPVYDEKYVKVLPVEEVTHLLRKALRNWCTEH